MSLYPPQKVRLKKDTSELEIIWQNGDVAKVSGDQLRRYCACSSCRSRQLIGVRLVTESAELSAVNLIGSTALQVVFADGHDRGIFPWPYVNAIAAGRIQEFLNA